MNIDPRTQEAVFSTSVALVLYGGYGTGKSAIAAKIAGCFVPPGRRVHVFTPNRPNMVALSTVLSGDMDTHFAIHETKNYKELAAAISFGFDEGDILSGDVVMCDDLSVMATNALAAAQDKHGSDNPRKLYGELKPQAALVTMRMGELVAQHVHLIATAHAEEPDRDPKSGAYALDPTTGVPWPVCFELAARTHRDYFMRLFKQVYHVTRVQSSPIHWWPMVINHYGPPGGMIPYQTKDTYGIVRTGSPTSIREVLRAAALRAGLQQFVPAEHVELRQWQEPWVALTAKRLLKQSGGGTITAAHIDAVCKSVAESLSAALTKQYNKPVQWGADHPRVRWFVEDAYARIVYERQIASSVLPDAAPAAPAAPTTSAS